MKEFGYKNATTITEALTLLDGQNARVVAGGTNVLPYIRSGKYTDCRLINIRDIKDLNFIKEDSDRITIGACVTISQLKKSKIILEFVPALHQAACVFADPTICNTATVGGNLASASPAADTAPALLVHDAIVFIKSLNSSRSVPLSEFFKAPGTTVLQRNELITHIEISKQKNSGFIKLGMRKSMSISIVTAASSVTLNDAGIISSCKIALGAVAPTPIRAAHTERFLLSKKPDDDTLSALIKATNLDISPIDDIRASADYRREVTPVMVKRAIKLALYEHC